MLTLYSFGAAANSLKPTLALYEKGLQSSIAGSTRARSGIMPIGTRPPTRAARCPR